MGVDVMNLDQSAKNTLKLENTEKRDTLIANEKRYQAQWQKAKIFEADAPTTTEIPSGSMNSAELQKKYPKFFGTFPYPYMNGALHAGHSFTISKVEFTAGFARMQGKRVLFPLGFHVTGMPIKACADKLVDDMKKFGRNFERYEEEDNSITRALPAPTQGQTKEDITKFTSKKGKVSAKAVNVKYQFQIMLALGIPKEEIHKFADAEYWLHFFPPICKQDLNSFGARIDWRRDFLTTDANPYYDAFVRWQMNRLRELDKIQYGVRYCIYSPKDGQPCMDHDRTSGEGVGPQDYTAMKLKVKEWAPKAAELIGEKLPKGASVYLVPATLRPETMYGQTCCFVGPKITYGIFKVSDLEFFVMTLRAAWNLSFQGIFFDSDYFPKDQNELPLVIELPGSAMVGTLVNAPLSVHTKGVRVLPMESVLPTKGTGVVTSVPSDSPDDYVTLKDLAKKADYYGISKEWAELEIVPVVETPSYGNLTAKFIAEKMKINSPKDTKQLAEAKDLAYKEGFYKGTMLVGEFKGESVEAAKPKIREALLKSQDAFAYAEPTSQVVSRSADECVVAYLGQWFLNYGENDPEWRQQASDYVANGLETYQRETKNAFEAMLEWLNRWACARTYGLGSKLPWDRKFLVESLSDSTIYHCYYTVAHLLHEDTWGNKPGVLSSIKPDQMTDEIWDYIFCRRELSSKMVEKSGISKGDLQCMRREFEYWYPLDINSSGKELIGNHLTFFIYVHIALFPKEYWPKSIRCNGHLLLNGDKMSKSTGNFLTLRDAIEKYGADATRIALADAGDGVEDANFEESVANSNILRLFNLKDWIEDVVKDKSLRRGSPDGFWDTLFENEMNALVLNARENYEGLEYKLALKSSLYDFTGARDFYREATSAAGIGMNHDLVLRYVEFQALLLTPIAPHWCDYIWQEVLLKPSTLQNALWPTVPSPSVSLSAAREYVRSTSSNITSAEAVQQKKKDKGKSIAYDPKRPKKLTIFAADKYPAWQQKYIDVIREELEKTQLNDDKELLAKVSKMGETKKAMPFVQSLKRKLTAGEKAETVFDRKLAFDEVGTLMEMTAGLRRTTGCKVVEVVVVDEGGKTGTVVLGKEGEGTKKEGLPQAAEVAVPGQPSFHFENIEE